MMLVGRDGEIAALNTLFRDSCQGKGIVAVLRGPAASGKTALLRFFAEQVTAVGALLLSAVGSRAERGLPLGIVDQLFRGSDLPAAIVPRVAGIMETRTLIGTDETSPGETVSPVLARVFEGLLELLAELSESVPVVIAVDDLQHADSASLQYLSYLARRASTARILMVFAERTQALPADRLVRAEILRQGNCQSISLAPLSPSAVASLLREHVDSKAALSLAPACHAMTGGNPLLVNALAEDSLSELREPQARLIPASGFRSAVVTCLHSYEPRLVELAEALAVLGEHATPILLGEMLETTAESAGQGMDALAASGLLESGRFRHPMARQAVLEHMTADERGASHASAARILYRTGAASTVLAGHLMAAHRVGTEWTVPVLQDAAERALADGEPDRAIGYLRRAETEIADERQRAAIRFAWACAEWRINPERAVRHMTDLVPDARAGRLDGDCAGRLAYYLLWAGDTTSAAEVLATLDTATGSLTEHAAIWSALDFLYPDVARRVQRVQRVRRGMPPTRDAEGDDTEDALSGAERILQEHGENERALASITTALMALIGDDRLDRAAFWCNVLRHESEGRGFSPLWDAVLTGFWAMIETRRGNLPAAENHARTALTLLTRKGWGVAIGNPLSSLLLTAIATRRHEDAAAYLRVPVPEAMFGTPYGLLYLHARGEYYLATGRAQAALADFQACGDRMITWGLDRPGLVPWRTKAAEAHLEMGDQDAARELSEEQLARVGPRPSRTRGISLRALALTSPLNKRIALLKESAEILRGADARLELAYTFADLGDAHRAAGDHDRAHWAARQAQNLMERCGARAPKHRNNTRNTDRHERSNGNGNGNGDQPPTQLSNAERRVAMLAAYGYTNCQIATKLYITVSTVEQHLTRVYRKLGVSGRAELPIEI